MPDDMTFYLQSIYQEALGSTIIYLPKFIISGFFVFILFYIMYVIIGVIFNKILSRKNGNQRSIIKLLRKLTRVLLVIFGIVTIFGTWGIDINALVAGLGLTGFALGFALKDVLASTLAGALIMIHKPFKVGDIIESCGTKGEVTYIDIRHTVIAEKDRRHLVPNSKLLSETVTVLNKK